MRCVGHETAPISGCPYDCSIQNSIARVATYGRPFPLAGWHAAAASQSQHVRLGVCERDASLTRPRPERYLSIYPSIPLEVPRACPPCALPVRSCGGQAIDPVTNRGARAAHASGAVLAPGQAMMHARTAPSMFPSVHASAPLVVDMGGSSTYQPS